MNDKLTASIRRPNITKELADIYEKYPELRGKSANSLVSLAWDRMIHDLL